MELFISQYLLGRIVYLSGGPLWTTGLRASCRIARERVMPPGKYGDEEDLLIRSAIDGDYGGLEYALSCNAIGYLEAIYQAASHGRYSIFRRLAPFVNSDLRLSRIQRVRLLSLALCGGNKDIISATLSSFKCDRAVFRRSMAKIAEEYYSGAAGMLHCVNLLDTYADDKATSDPMMVNIVCMYRFLYGFTGDERFASRVRNIQQERFGAKDKSDFNFFLEAMSHYECPPDAALIGAAQAGRMQGCVEASGNGASWFGYVGMGLAAVRNRDLAMLQQAYIWLGHSNSHWVSAACDLGYADVLQWLFANTNSFDFDDLYPVSFYSEQGYSAMPAVNIPSADTTECHAIVASHLGSDSNKYFTYQLKIGNLTLDYQRFKMFMARCGAKYADELAFQAILVGNTWALKLALKNGAHLNLTREQITFERSAYGAFVQHMSRQAVYSKKMKAMVLSQINV